MLSITYGISKVPSYHGVILVDGWLRPSSLRLLFSFRVVKLLYVPITDAAKRKHELGEELINVITRKEKVKKQSITVHYLRN
jgi:hypothetical protein